MTNPDMPISDGQFQKTMDLYTEKGMDQGKYQILIESGFLADLFEANPLKVDRDALRNLLGLSRFPGRPEILEVNYTKNLDQMIAAGDYNWKNDNITPKKFPIKGDGVVKVERKLFNWDEGVSSDEAVRRIVAEDQNHSWTPAQIEFLLASGAKYPQEQKEFPIVGLGSSCEVGGDVRVPCLVGGRSRRSLYLFWRSDDWRRSYRFLAVRPLVL